MEDYKYERQNYKLNLMKKWKIVWDTNNKLVKEGKPIGHYKQHSPTIPWKHRNDITATYVCRRERENFSYGFHTYKFQSSSKKLATL